VKGPPPQLDLDKERALQRLVVTLAGEALVRSAHDCSDGGIAITVAESCFDAGGMGAEVSIPAASAASDRELNDAAALFGESASRIVVSVAPDCLTRVLEEAAAMNVAARVIGQTGGNRLRVAVDGRVVVDLAVDEAERAWSGAIEAFFARRVA
jgi:phosphoribosylformylglycinamidine synthase